jgi:selenide,water dikinase
LDSADDAAVWKLDERQSLVITTDFFTPVVDDPYDYGAIAAANSLSDVYAMGAKPFLALNIAAFPPNLPNEISQAIVRGAAEKCREAGVVVAGGHTITDNEPKFGLVAIGIAETEKILTKGGAKPGDHLFLSKPLGFGVTTTALKRGLTNREEVAEVTGWMKCLNRDIAMVAVECGLKAATDITGFSLLGHASEIAQASQVGLELYFDQIPLITPARKYADAYTFPGGASDNKLWFGSWVSFDPALNESDQMLLFDPQTSGGLLLCVPEDCLTAFLEKAKERDIPVWEIGKVTSQLGLRVHKVF